MMYLPERKKQGKVRKEWAAITDSTRTMETNFEEDVSQMCT